LIGLSIAQRRRQAALGIGVNQKNFFAFIGKPDTEIFTSRGLSNPAFLVCYCNYCVRELSPPSNKISANYETLYEITFESPPKEYKKSASSQKRW
jgi:hypothetical protein